MATTDPLEIFLIATPGLEAALCDEARSLRFAAPAVIPGGVALRGTWTDVWRANLELRGPTRVLVRLARFRAQHLSELDKRSRRVDWRRILRPDVAVHVEAVCRKSKIYHSGAAAERIGRAISEELGASISPEADVTVMARLENDICTISVDTSGEPLHKRGYKEATAKAPIRETMAALFLRQCGYDGTCPVLDPMCGSGTFVIEAAEIAAGLKPGRSRSFAFEKLATYDADAWQALKQPRPAKPLPFRFFGSDRDAGAIRMSEGNAARAGLSSLADFNVCPVADLTRPDGPAGLVIVNPPYGDRIGDKSRLSGLYRTLGQVLMSRFGGWRVGLVTSSRDLARSTRLPFLPPGRPVSHGGIGITLYRTDPLP
ncbi:MAG: class I SAM-dependent RNA methyltransferase [Proteobacteria bacterium]|nr:class I SAM-dependent RNA methyltransferase [Pseudomonadota bacterium]